MSLDVSSGANFPYPQGRLNGQYIWNWSSEKLRTGHINNEEFGEYRQ